MSKTTKQRDLEVEIEYDKQEQLVTVSFLQDERLITVGFDIGEAQVFNAKLAEAITDGILDTVGLPSGVTH